MLETHARERGRETEKKRENESTRNARTRGTKLPSDITSIASELHERCFD